MRLEVSQGAPLLLAAAAREVEAASIADLRASVERALDEHRRRFGNAPFRIEYFSGQGYAIVANAAIGRVDCGAFLLDIAPKVPGLEIGKCLQLAHRCQFEAMVRHFNTLVEDNISDADDLDGLEYFGASFASAVAEVARAGLVRRPGSIIERDPDVRGEVQFERQIAEGASPVSPITRRPLRDIDTPVNRTLVTALRRVREGSTNNDVRALADWSLGEFTGVPELALTDVPSYDLASAVPRDDYATALDLARAIIEGFDPAGGDEAGFTPAFTLDLDALFESYVRFELGELLSGGALKMQSQGKYPHPIKPDLRDKHIIPDLTIRSDNRPGAEIVLDTKNKYSSLVAGKPNVSNPDLFQIAYYGQAMGAHTCLLVYPGGSSDRTKFPLPGSESPAKYEEKAKKAEKALQGDSSTYLCIGLKGRDVDVFLWRVDLTGSIWETRRSLAELASFLVYRSRRLCWL